MKSIKAHARQTLFDISIQEFGSVEAAFEILQNNPALEGITVDLPEGMILQIPDISEFTNTAIRDYLADEKIATGNYVAPVPVTVQRHYGPAYKPTQYR